MLSRRCVPDGMKGIVGPMHYISHTLQKMVADIEKNQGDLSVRFQEKMRLVKLEGM